MGLKNPERSPMELMDAVEVRRQDNFKLAGVSMGGGLRQMIQLSEVGKEFKGDCDGVDALCHHLNGDTCRRAIEALQKVLERFQKYDGEMQSRDA
jgi:hypothetical protein